METWALQALLVQILPSGHVFHILDELAKSINSVNQQR